MNRMIDAIDDGYRALAACGCPVPQADLDFVRGNRRKCYWMLKIMAATPIGRLACSDHAMSARDEMRRLYDDFCSLKEQAGIATPAWDESAQCMIQEEVHCAQK